MRTSFLSKNPYTRQVLHNQPFFTQDEVKTQIKSLYATFEKNLTEPVERKKARLEKIATLLLANKEELAHLITSEMGKPINQATMEIERCANHCRFYEQNYDTLIKQTVINTEAIRSGYILRPTGVVFKIVPFNFPLWVGFKCISPNIALGNTILMRPSEQTPLTGKAFGDMLENAGIDQLKVVFSSPQDTEFILQQDEVSGVSFTGSTQSGKLISEIAGRNLKKSVFELGGSDPFVLMRDLVTGNEDSKKKSSRPSAEEIKKNLQFAAKIAISSRVGNNGQVCCAAKRFIVPDIYADDFIKELAYQLDTGIKMGDPLQPDVNLGPLGKEMYKERIQQQLASLDLTNNQKVYGEQISPLALDNFVSPQIYETTDLSGVLMTEEIFAPVFTIYRTKSDLESLKIANSSKYGLGATVIGVQHDKALELGQKINCGMLFVNAVVKADTRFPCGGEKQSGIGRDCGSYGITSFANTQSYFVNQFGN